MSRAVFISYASIDETDAKNIGVSLEEINIEYFLDRKDIKWGDDFAEEIKKALTECEAVIVVLSPASIKSQWVPFEVGHAIGAQKRILPYLTHPSVEIPGFLQRLQYATSIDEVKSFFQSFDPNQIQQTAIVPTDTPATDETPEFDKSAAAEHIMSAVITGYVRRMSDATDKGESKRIRDDLADKLHSLGQRAHMPPHVFDLYIDMMLKHERYLPVHEFITTLQDPELIKSLEQSQGEHVVSWLMRCAFGHEDSEEHNPTDA